MLVDRREKITKIKYLEVELLLFGLTVSILGYYSTRFNIAITGICLIFLANIVYSIKNLKKYFIFFFMQITIFTFLIARPFIGMLKGISWWNNANQAKENVWFALILILLTEVALYLGANITEILLRQKLLVKKRNESAFKYYLQVVSFGVFLVTMLFYLIEQFEPILMIGSGNYLAYYTEFQSNLPSIFHTIASFMKYSLCLFLATMPTKRKAYIALALYVLSTLPSLLIGVRNPFVLSLFFSLTYFLLRDYLKDSKKWIGKVEKILIAICTPVFIAFLTLYSYIRVGNGAKVQNPLSVIADFFYGQGVTFDVLSIGYGYIPGARIIQPCNYTFGGFIDYIYRGTIGQKLFHTEPLTSYNSIFNAENSNSFSHVLSYLSFKGEYLKGHGRGSSYLLEVYVDFDYIGVIVFSLILGALLIYIVNIFGKNTLMDTIILVSLTTIFFIPRAEATGWLTFIVTIQFWVCMVGCYLCAFLCKKWKVIDKVRQLLKVNKNKE